MEQKNLLSSGQARLLAFCLFDVSAVFILDTVINITSLWTPIGLGGFRQPSQLHRA
jgi:hypothetical protein